MATNLKLIRLFTGEDLMGEIIETTDRTIKVKNAVRVVVIPNKTTPDQPGVAFAPFTHWSKDTEIDVNSHHVLAVLNPIAEFINQYNATFGGLVVPDTKLILPGQE